MKKVILLTMAALFAFAALAYAQTVPADKLQIKLNEAWNVKPQTQKGGKSRQVALLANRRGRSQSAYYRKRYC